MTKSFLTNCHYCFSFSRNVAHFKQAANLIFHSHLLLILAPTFYPLKFCQKVWLTFLYIKLCPFINQQFSIYSCLDWEGHHRVFANHDQTTATQSLMNWALNDFSAAWGWPDMDVVLCWIMTQPGPTTLRPALNKRPTR